MPGAERGFMARLTKKQRERAFARIEAARRDPTFPIAVREFIAVTTGKQQPHKHRPREAGL